MTYTNQYSPELAKALYVQNPDPLAIAKRFGIQMSIVLEDIDPELQAAASQASKTEKVPAPPYVDAGGHYSVHPTA